MQDSIGQRPQLSFQTVLDNPACTSIITKDTAFGDMYLVEIARGCPFSCKFCSAREIYAPYRSAPMESLIPIFDEAARHRNKLGLVSTSLNNHPAAAEIFKEAALAGAQGGPAIAQAGHDQQ